MASAQFILKILAGPNQGAEIALSDPTLSIGTSEESDLILSDSLVQPDHLSLNFNENGSLSIFAKANIFINGEEYEASEEAITLNPFDFLSLGTTHIVIGPANEKWPNLSAADIPQLKRKSTEATLEGTNDEDSAPTEGPKKEDAEPKTNPSTQEPIPFYKRKRYQFGAAAGILLISAILLGVFGIKNTPSLPDRPKDLTETLTGIVAGFDYRDIFEIEDQGTSIELRAWLRNDEELALLKKQLRPYQSWLKVKLYTQEDIVEQAIETFKLMGLELSVESPKPGTLRVEGFVNPDALWQKAKATMLAEIPGLREIIDEVIDPQEAMEAMNFILRDFQLAQYIHITPHRNSLIAEGSLPESLLPAWEQAREVFWQRAGYPIPINNLIIITTPETIFLDINIQSVHIGNRGWLVTADGQKLFEGGLIGGYTIDSITAEHIVLKKDNERITLNIGD